MASHTNSFSKTSWRCVSQQLLLVLMLSTQTAMAQSQCPMTLSLYASWEGCQNGSIPPLGTGVISADGTCRTVQPTSGSDTVEAVAAALPGIYRATCDRSTNPTVTMVQSGCTSMGACRSAVASDTQCDANDTVPSFVYSRVDNPYYSISPSDSVEDRRCIRASYTTSAGTMLEVVVTVQGECTCGGTTDATDSTTTTEEEDGSTIVEETAAPVARLAATASPTSAAPVIVPTTTTTSSVAPVIAPTTTVTTSTTPAPIMTGAPTLAPTLPITGAPVRVGDPPVSASPITSAPVATAAPVASAPVAPSSPTTATTTTTRVTETFRVSLRPVTKELTPRSLTEWIDATEAYLEDTSWRVENVQGTVTAQSLVTSESSNTRHRSLQIAGGDSTTAVATANVLELVVRWNAELISGESDDDNQSVTLISLMQSALDSGIEQDNYLGLLRDGSASELDNVLAVQVKGLDDDDGSNSNSSDDGNEDNIGFLGASTTALIAGGGVAFLVALILCCLGCRFCRRRDRENNNAAKQKEPTLPSTLNSRRNRWQPPRDRTPSPHDEYVAASASRRRPTQQQPRPPPPKPRRTTNELILPTNHHDDISTLEGGTLYDNMTLGVRDDPTANITFGDGEDWRNHTDHGSTGGDTVLTKLERLGLGSNVVDLTTTSTSSNSDTNTIADFDDTYQVYAKDLFPKVTHDAKVRVFTVHIPPGLLGMVLQDGHPKHTVPSVRALRDSSPLKHALQVGDLVLAVDHQDVTGWSAVQVSDWVGDRRNAVRRSLVMVRPERALFD